MSAYYRPRGFGRQSLMPPVLKILLISNIAVYILQHFLLSTIFISGEKASDWFSYYFALMPFAGKFNWFGVGDFYLWQLLTYQFLHANFWHIAFNMFVLWMFGAELENLWGSSKFLFFYLLSGIGAGLAHLFIHPLFDMAAPAIGASGSIFGLLIAFGMTFPNRSIIMFPFFIPIKAKYFVIIMIAIGLFNGIAASDNTAHFAHLGGAAMGFLLMKYGDQFGIFDWLTSLFVKNPVNDYHYEPLSKEAKVFSVKWMKKDEGNTTYEPKQASINVDGEEITQQRIDEILDKISDNGYDNLTDKEKRILYELSQKLK